MIDYEYSDIKIIKIIFQYINFSIVYVQYIIFNIMIKLFVLNFCGNFYIQLQCFKLLFKLCFILFYKFNKVDIYLVSYFDMFYLYEYFVKFLFVDFVYFCVQV